MIDSILLDQDCVLADFFSAALNKLNRKYRKENPASMDEYRKYGDYSIEQFFNISIEEFWKCLEDSNYFWDELPSYPWSKSLYDFLKRFAPVTIVSSPSDGLNCVYGKVQWLKKYIDPDIATGDCVFTKKKYLLANPNTLLIDDLQENCDKFIEAGGHAVCVPSTWNTKNLQYNDILERIIKHPAFGK